MHTQPNLFDHYFDVITNFSGLPGTPIVGPGLHVDAGYRNFPSIHQLVFVWGGTVNLTDITAKLQGTLNYDPPNTPTAEWFDIGVPLTLTEAGPTNLITSELVLVRGIRYVISAVSGGTAPTMQPIYAGHIG